MKIIFVFFIQTFSAFSADFNYCPDWVSDEDYADFPNNQSTLLHESRPALVRIISKAKNPQTTVDFVMEAFKASQNKIPLMVLPGIKHDDEIMLLIKNAIQNFNISEEIKRKWLGALTLVDTVNEWTWQQDYFKAFIDRNGKPTIRPILDYHREDEGFFCFDYLKEIYQAIEKKCPGLINFGDYIPTNEESSAIYQTNIISGGNFQGLPLGLVAHGNLQDWDDFVKFYGGKYPYHAISILTSWLNIGHIDEFLGFIVNEPLKQVIIINASPKLALNILNDENYKNRLFFEWINNANRILEEELNLFNKLAEFIRFQRKLENNNLNDFINTHSITNQEMANIFNSDLLYISAFNDIIEEIILNNANKIKICLNEKGYNVINISVPQLFYALEEQTMQLNGLPNNAISLLPNLANFVCIYNTIIFPEPLNEAFRTYIQSIFFNKFEVKFIDTKIEHFIGGGNLHCMTNMIPVGCKKKN